MFGFFKRTKIENWELELLKKIMIQVDSIERTTFINQIDDGLFRGVLIGYSDIPNYVGFSYNSKIHDKYYNKNGLNYKYSNINVFDNISNQYLLLEIYVCYGLIIGYSINKPIGIKKMKLDTSGIVISNLIKIYKSNNDFNKISNILSDLELELLNPNDVYLLNINGVEYYHLQDLEDGDFIGLDLNKNIYKITHDPFEINILKLELKEILKGTIQ